MSNKLYTVYRTISLNGETLEVGRNFGLFSTSDAAEARAESLYESVSKLPATRGLCFNFYVKEVIVDAEVDA